MDSFWFAAYLVLVAVAIAHAVLVTLQTWEHRRYVRSCMGALGRYRPRGRAAVFAPCKGIDVQLQENLRTLLRQDYDDYEVVFIVESRDDPAVAVIRRVMAEHPDADAKLVIAGKATQCGQKVHNLRAATAELSPRVEYLAFVDSDARLRREWLRALIGQIGRAKIGAVTGYRWFMPVRDSLPNHLLYSLNCNVMSLLGRSSHYLIWGGSWGIRREVFESIDLHRAWEGTLSDDLVASRQLRRAGLATRFEPACVAASPVDDSLRGMLSFIRRQYTVGRFYVPAWWALAILATTFTQAVWLANLAAVGFGLARASPPLWIPLAASAVLYVLCVTRGLFRQDLLRIYFPERRQALRKASRFDVWFSPVAGLAHWLGVLGSLFGRQITWRGVGYCILRGGKIRAVGRGSEDKAAAGNEEDRRRRDCPAPYRKAG